MIDFWELQIQNLPIRRTYPDDKRKVKDKSSELRGKRPGQLSPKKLSQINRGRILELLDDYFEWGAPEVSEELDIHPNTARKTLMDLEDLGLLTSRTFGRRIFFKKIKFKENENV